MDPQIAKLEEENSKLRDTMGHIHAAYVEMVAFCNHLREQIRRNLYFDPPPGITYGIHTRTIGTQTDFVPPKTNERTDREIAALLERDGC